MHKLQYILLGLMPRANTKYKISVRTKGNYTLFLSFYVFTVKKYKKFGIYLYNTFAEFFGVCLPALSMEIKTFFHSYKRNENNISISFTIVFFFVFTYHKTSKNVHCDIRKC